MIVGAGVGGLAFSRALARRGVRHVVLERDTEPGGVIRTIRAGGRVLEAGPQRLRLTAAMRELVRTLRLEDQLVVAPRGLPLFIYRRGALCLAPLSLTDLRRTDLFSRTAKLRILAEPLTRPAREGETVAEYFTRRFGGAAYEDLLGPLFGGLYASDPADMLVRHALLPALRELGGTRSTVLALLRRAVARGRRPTGIRGDVAEGAAACSFRSGLRTLTDAMHDSVREHVRLGKAAVAIEKSADGYRVSTSDGEITAGHVVLTCPAPETAALLRHVAPRAAGALEALHYNRIAIVHLLAEGVRPGMGYQVSLAEPLQTRGVTFNHALFARDRVYTAFLGGARDPDLSDSPDDTIAALAAREFRQVTGRAAEPINVARACIPAWDRCWTAFDDLRLPEGIRLCANYESRIGVFGRIARAEQLAAAMAGHVSATR